MDVDGNTDPGATRKLAVGAEGVPAPLLLPPPLPNLRRQQQKPELAQGQQQQQQQQQLRAPQPPQQRQRQREQARQLALQAAAVRQDLAELTNAYRPFLRRTKQQQQQQQLEQPQQRQQGGERGRGGAAAGHPGPAFVSVDQGDMDAAIEHTFPPTSRKAAAAAALAAAADRALAGTAGTAARRQPWPPGPAHVANVLVVSAALMNQRNEVLLSKRVRGSIRFRGMYEFPGGKVGGMGAWRMGVGWLGCRLANARRVCALLDRQCQLSVSACTATCTAACTALQVEPGEIPQYALQRELLEEIGVEVRHFCSCCSCHCRACHCRLPLQAGSHIPQPHILRIQSYAVLRC